jgi:thiol-disulfide isomerase/thioredoxin
VEATVLQINYQNINGLLIGLALILYFFVFKPMSTTQVNYSANNERDTYSSQNSNSKDAEIMFFYVDWCPHCKTAKPAWNDVKGEYENKTINGYKVIFTEINCTEETAEVESLMNKYNIEGFPTIKLLKDGQVIEYDAKPTKETLTQFLNTVL